MNASFYEQRRARKAIRAVLSCSRKVAEVRWEGYALEKTAKRVMTLRQNALRRALKRFDEITGGKQWFKIDWDHVLLLATQIDAAESAAIDAALSSRGPDALIRPGANAAMLNTWECVDKFLEAYPLGFNDPEYRGREREPKDEAREAFFELLGQYELRRLLDTGNFEEVAERALRVVDSMDLIPLRDATTLKDGLRAPAAQRTFAVALDGLLYGRDHERSRFEKWSNALRGIGVQTWPVAGFFQFLLHPESRMYIESQVIQEAARVLGGELTCPAEVAWETYSRIQRFADAVRHEIRELGPHDMIDVQSFIWCIARGG